MARPLALLLLIWPTWFLAGISPAPFTRRIAVTLILLGAAGWFWAYRSGWITRDWLRTLVIVEALSLLAFASYVALRGYTPEITWTEKPMDVAFLTSSTRTQEIPPADPWFSGEPINYYYLGYFVHATVGRLARGSRPGPATTWRWPRTVSMAIVAAGGVAFNALRRFAARVWRCVGNTFGFLVVLAGNMRAPVEYLRDRQAAIDQDWWGTIGWSSSRIVIDTGSQQAETINEFPCSACCLATCPAPHRAALHDAGDRPGAESAVPGSAGVSLDALCDPRGDRRCRGRPLSIK